MRLKQRVRRLVNRVKKSVSRPVPSPLFGKLFSVKQNPGALELVYRNNFGATNQKTELIQSIHFRPSQVGFPLSKWKLEQRFPGAAVFSTPGNHRVIVKEEAEVFPKIGKLGRSSDRRHRRSIPVLLELMRRRVYLETPVGFLMTQKGREFVITKAVKGTPLQALESYAPQIRRKIVEELAVQLAGLHKKDVVHLHPHQGNWMMDGLKLRLVDAKGVAFKSDFPHQFKVTGRILTWNEIIENDKRVVLSFIPKSLHGLWNQSYAAAAK